MNNKYISHIYKNDDINSIFQKYSSLINKDLNELLFFYNGKYLNIGNNILNFPAHYFRYLKEDNIVIFVFPKKQKKNNNEKIKDIICPECKY